MGRHKAMPSASEPSPPSPLIPALEPVPDRERYERLKSMSINRPPALRGDGMCS